MAATGSYGLSPGDLQALMGKRKEGKWGHLMPKFVLCTLYNVQWGESSLVFGWWEMCILVKNEYNWIKKFTRLKISDHCHKLKPCRNRRNCGCIATYARPLAATFPPPPTSTSPLVANWFVTLAAQGNSRSILMTVV